QRLRLDNRRKLWQFQRLVVPTQSFSGVAANQPEQDEPECDVTGFFGSIAFDQPRHRRAVGFEVTTDAIQPFRLCRSEQTLLSQSPLGHRITREAFDRVAVFTALTKLSARVRTDGFEHAIVLTRRHW